MPDYVTDTHGLIWYLEDSPRLGRSARKVFSSCDQGDCFIYVPTICLVEIVYLQEKRRISADLKMHLDTGLSSSESGLLLADLTFEIANMVSVVPREQVPDMPDRIIAATALYMGLPLISRDRKIRLSAVKTIW